MTFSSILSLTALLLKSLYIYKKKYGPKWLWAEMVMGRYCHGPKWLWAEMTSYRYNDLPKRIRVVSAWVVSANFGGGSFRPR